METYRSMREQQIDKALLEAMSDALDAASNALRLDECRTWTIRGSRGHVATWGDGERFLLYVECRSAQHWTWTKKRLAFCEVMQDAEADGVLRCQLPLSKDQAGEIRYALGIRSTRPPPPHAFTAEPDKKGGLALPQTEEAFARIQTAAGASADF